MTGRWSVTEAAVAGRFARHSPPFLWTEMRAGIWDHPLNGCSFLLPSLCTHHCHLRDPHGSQMEQSGMTKRSKFVTKMKEIRNS